MVSPTIPTTSVAASVSARKQIPASIANAKAQVVSYPSGPQALVVDFYVNDDLMRRLPDLGSYDPSRERPVITRQAKPDTFRKYVREEIVDEGYVTGFDPASYYAVSSKYVGETPEGWSHHRLTVPLAANDSGRDGASGIQTSLNVNLGNGREMLVDIPVFPEY